MTTPSKLWIKICGMTTPEAVEACLEAKVDAIGFVFAPSVRQVTPARAASLTAPARGRAVCTAVTRHPTQQAIDEIIEVFQPDLLQTDSEDLRDLRLPPGLQVLPVFRRWDGNGHDLPARLLFEGHISGSGTTANWATASQLARKSELILAGGLNAANVAAAIAAVNPFGVDVSSGVEERPGIKSQAEIARFVTVARQSFKHAPPGLRPAQHEAAHSPPGPRPQHQDASHAPPGARPQQQDASHAPLTSGQPQEKP